jgi:hypothetical protein
MFAKTSIASAAIFLGVLLLAAPHAQGDALSAATGYDQLLDPKNQLEVGQLFAFNGIIEADRTEKGQAEFHNQVDDVRMHIEIDCVLVRGLC